MHTLFPEFLPPSSRSLSSGEISICWISFARISSQCQGGKEGTDLLHRHSTNQILYQRTGSLPPMSNTSLGSFSPSDSSKASSSLYGARHGYCLRNSDSSRTLNVSGSSLAFTLLAASSKQYSYAKPPRSKQSLRISERLSSTASSARNPRICLACPSLSRSRLAVTWLISPVR
jgi:hypothetical protein